MGMGDELTVSDLTARGTRGITESVSNLKTQDMFSRVPSLPVTKDEHTKAKRIAKGVYCGEESRSGIPHGTGVLVSTSGHRFEGEWANGEMHGRGNCSEDGRILYEGMWKKGKMTGEGTKKTASGVVESGNFNNGQLEGYGDKFTPGNGVRYIVCVRVSKVCVRNIHGWRRSGLLEIRNLWNLYPIRFRKFMTFRKLHKYVKTPRFTVIWGGSLTIRFFSSFLVTLTSSVGGYVARV